MTLKNKTILITGSNQGLGEELAYKTAKLGATVLLLARREDLLSKVRSKIRQDGGKAKSYPCDLRDQNQVKSTVKSIIAKHKQIDILVNNAGVWTDNELEKDNPDLRNQAILTNTLGNIQITEALLPHFNKLNQGIIFNVISSAGVPEIPSGNNNLWKSYGASKWGFTGYTHALRESLRDTKIKVIQYFPGGFESNLYENANRPNPHNQPWMMKTTDVADIIIFALTRPQDVYMEKIVVTKG